LKDLISILLIDDDEDDYLITRDILDEISHQRYRMEWVSSYDEARDSLREQRHDVYLVDFRLGAHSGLELIQEAHSQGWRKPIILLTGQGDFETDAQAMKFGAADYLIKGQLTADTLERSIRYAIRHANNLREIRVLNTELEARVERRTEALRQAVADLRQSQQLFTSIGANFPNGAIMVLDMKLNFVFIDGSELPWLEHPSINLVGKPMLHLFSEDVQSVVEYYLLRVKEGENLSFELKHKSSIYYMRGVPLENASGEIDQLLLVSNNVTLEKRAEEEMRRALKKERELNELKTRFVSMASHEFRTPLSTILSSVSLIDRYTASIEEPKRVKHVERIKSSVRNLTGILEDFLSLTRLEEGHVDPRPEWFDPSPFLSSVAEEVEGLTKENQKIDFQSSGGEEVFLDKHLLRNILTNLLSNAIKYSGSGTTIRVTAEVSQAHFTLSVADQGIGIPEVEQAHLFERFYRANNASNIQGTGLGLNIVQKYISLMNGNISFESRENEGSTFTVSCPRVFEGKSQQESWI